MLQARAAAAAMRVLTGGRGFAAAATASPATVVSAAEPSYTVLPPGSSMAEPSYVPPPQGPVPKRAAGAKARLIRLSGAARRKPLLSHDNPSSTFGLPPGSSVSDPKYSFSLRDPVYAVDPK